MFAIADEEEESSEKKEYFEKNAAISEQVSNTDNLHLFSENLGKSMQYPRSRPVMPEPRAGGPEGPLVP